MTIDNRTAAGRFAQLDGMRAGYMRRAERHAAFSLRRLCLPKDYDQNSDAIQNDWQSVGAQGTNHLGNKLMLTMFAPSRPFIRYGFTDASLAAFKAKLGLDPQQAEEWAAEGERKAVKEMDKQPLRPPLFDVCVRLIVIGDALLYLPNDPANGVPASYDLHDYVHQRTPAGKTAELIVRESVAVADLKPDARAVYRPGEVIDDTLPVNLYRWIKRGDDDMLHETQWIETTQLPEVAYSRSYRDEDAEFHGFAWHLPKGAHYGIGHVEEYAGAFAALSALSRAEVEGALLASEFRWLVNPGGVTKVDDIMNSRNGAAVPGLPGDVHLLNNSKPGDLQIVNKAADGHIRVLGRAFLMPSAVTRDAERVTTEELRQQAMELETGLGGVYTRLSGTLQLTVGHWLTKKIGIKLVDGGIVLSIITGLDALSRNGDLAALRAALGDVAALQNLGNAAGVLKLSVVVSDIFMGHGLQPSKYVKTPNEIAADNKAAEEAAARQAQTEANAKATATAQ